MRTPIHLFFAAFAATVLASMAEANRDLGGDAEALAVLSAINQNEIDAANLALTKDVPIEVKEFAVMMQIQHKENLEKTRRLARQIKADDAEDPAVEDLRAKGKKEMTALASMDGRAFSEAYMEAMVRGHMDALDTLDARLLKIAEDGEVKRHLRDTRSHVARHLAEARKLRTGLQAGRREDVH